VNANDNSRRLDPIDERLLNEMQDRFPLVREPFRELAARVEAGEADVIERLAALRASGILRQVSPIFDTKALGYTSSLVAMRVPEDRLREAARIVNAHPGVSHNYRRTHPFNLWFTIAVPPGSDLRAHISSLHELAGAESTRPLPTLRLFKIEVTLDMSGERSMEHRSRPQYTHEMREAAAKEQLSARDIDVIRVVQGDLPLRSDPFAPAADSLGMNADELIEELHGLERRRYLRRFAAILRHRKAGFGVNGMAVWDVPEDQIRAVGETMAGYSAISHCYQRPRYEDWRYNLFTMIHARKRDECEQFVARLAEEHRLADHAVLYSTTEYKKARLSYFTPEHDAWERAHVPS